MTTWLVSWMVMLFPVAAEPLTHGEQNRLFSDIMDNGVPIGRKQALKLPPPVMPDGLTAAEQKQVIERLIGQDYSYAEFTRRSIVAPYLLFLKNDLSPSEKNAPSRGFDAYFLVYGDFQDTSDEAFLNRLLSLGRDASQEPGQPLNASTTLTLEQLAKRSIVIEASGNRRPEQIGHTTFDILDRVRLSVTGRVAWSQTPESVVAAVVIDPRFRNDAEFPNVWHPLKKTGNKITLGKPQPYPGAGLYLKLTRLAEPTGAVFVEEHVVFTEPVGWFDGANLLRSKLPPVVQASVRSIRREWQKVRPHSK